MSQSNLDGRPKVAGVGEVLWDMLPEGRRLGGAPANFAYHAATLGAAAFVVSAVGDDAEGRDLRTTLRQLGLHDDHVGIVVGRRTGMVEVALDAAGHPRYRIAEESAWDYWQMTDALRQFAGELQALSFGSLAQRQPTGRRAVQEFLRHTCGDCMRLFDVNLRQHYFDREVLEMSLGAANFLKISDEELPVLARIFDLPTEEAAALTALQRRWNLRLVVLTRGARGSVLMRDGEVDDFPGVPVQAVDTVGAGDAFGAAVIMGCLRKWPLRRINVFANQLAAHVCRHSGATPPLTEELKRQFSA